MKLAWPNRRLSRWSRRLLQRISLALVAGLLAVAFTIPAMAVAPSVLPGRPPSGPDLGETSVQIAQMERTILNFNTPNYAVRVFMPTGSVNPVMNVFRRTAPSRLELNAQPAIFRGAITADGFLTYESFGSRDGRNVIFRASHNRGTQQARLEILEQATNSMLLSESASGVSAPNMPEAPGTGALERNTLVGFETRDHAVRVFRDPADGLRKMNIYYKPTSQTRVNGQPATVDLVGLDPSECWITYYGGQQYNGIAARYYVQVSAGGSARLEVIDMNGAVLLAEPRISTVPLVTNVPPEDRPQCFDGTGQIPTAPLARYVAAVFGGEATLQQVNQVLRPGAGARIPGSLTCNINPRFESARQGQFINAAECDGRNDAEAVVSFLRGRGLNARLVYRYFRYR